MNEIDRIRKYAESKQSGDVYEGFHEDIAAIIARAQFAFTDQLTGLPNRHGLMAEWPILCSTQPAIAMLDLDGFKPVNDKYGHTAGDMVLVEVANRLKANVGVVTRLGGDEFVTILPGSIAHAVVMMRDAIDAIRQPIPLKGGTWVTVSASVGIDRAVSDDLSAVLACADSAMYRAKATHIGVAVYDSRYDECFQERPLARRRRRNR